METRSVKPLKALPNKTGHSCRLMFDFKEVLDLEHLTRGREFPFIDKVLKQKYFGNAAKCRY
jgi:hypothetical protein